MPPQIDIDLVYHLEPSAYGLVQRPDPRIEPAAHWVAQQFALQNLYLSLAIVDDATISQLNDERLGHAWPTDVISFVLDQSASTLEGEVIASGETAARICDQAGWSADDELLLYLIHGMLHVAGLDDIDPDQQQHMRRMEQACLLAVGVAQAEQYLSRFEQVFNGEFDQ
jgi:probable rRNA maturation factor